ncbi:MAG: RtcB family protein [Pseudomonadota bacterium]
MALTGKDLIDMGFAPGPWFGPALDEANARGLGGEALRAFLETHAPPPPIDLQKSVPFEVNIEAETVAEEANVAAVLETMRLLMKTPTVRAGAVMPDACPAGPVGTIPGGGVVAAEGAIHPGFHSADICCSVMVSELVGATPASVLNAVQASTHFGQGGRAEGQRLPVDPELIDAFRGNRFLNDQKILFTAESHMGTQGDGNHFAFVGQSKATGTVCLVTHHGSRGPGAGLYKAGMRVAEALRQRRSPATLKQNAWIDAESAEGRAYWDALQILRRWTKANHEVIHDRALAAAGADLSHRFWNEHNFVFREGDMFFHAKGATPIDPAFLPDTSGVQIVPLNMGAPILLVKGQRTQRNLGFAPHGAGRNLSRSAHLRGLGGRPVDAVFQEETQGIDARFWCGRPDLSELPSAYKNPVAVRAQMAAFDLADVVDEIMPYGAIMAGDWEHDAPWRRKRR